MKAGSISVGEVPRGIVCTLLALMAAWVSAATTTNNWCNTATDSTPIAPLLWSEPTNWEEGSYPNGSEAMAYFVTPTVSSDTVRWIQMPNEVTLSYLYFNKNSGNLRFIGGRLNMNGDFSTKTTSGSKYVFLYADLIPKKTITTQYLELCGDMGSAYQVGCSYGYLRHRLDLYANSAGEERVNPGTTYALSASWGNYAMFAPQGSDEDITATWTLSNGCAFATRPAGTGAHTLCAGTLVTSAGGELPSGTFLKRIFNDGMIELSQPAALNAGSADVALTFKAFSPRVVQRLDQINHAGTKTSLTISLSKYREKDDLRFVLGHIARPDDASDREVYRLILGTDTGIPGTLVFRNTRSLKCHVVYDNCHLEFAMPPETGYQAGLTHSAATRFKDSSSRARMTVTNNITAYITTITNFVGTLVKDGAGTLTTTLSNSYNSASALVNTGSLDVEEGRFVVLANGDGSEPGVASLTIGADGTLVIPPSGFRVNSLTVVAGAKLSGGPLYAESVSNAAALELLDGASVVHGVTLGEKGAPRVVNSVEPFVASNKPAFWVDARNEASFVGFAENGTNFVSRWNDTRGAGYMYATNTNVGVAYPRRIANDSSGQCYLYIGNRATTNPAEMEILVWSEALKNIRAVFMVRDPGVGCGQALLGGTAQRLGSRTSDFRRNYGQGTNLDSQLFQANLHDNVKNGVHYMNGEVTAWNMKYPNGRYSSGSTYWYRYLLQEVHTAGNACADCFGALFPDNASATSGNGNDSIAECIIYTNELTYAERLGVADYLMKKWCGAEVTFERFAAATNRLGELSVEDSLTVEVPEGSLESVDTVSASAAGSLTKTGDGELYFDDCVASNMPVRVAAGTLTFRAVRPTRDNLPAGAYVHFDAKKVDSLVTTNHLGDGTTLGVKSWTDCRGVGHLTANAVTTNLPTLKTATIGGVVQPVVDFGPHRSVSGSKTLITLGSATALSFENIAEARTLALVVGSSQGGGVLAGSTQSSQSGGIPRQNGGASASDTLFSGKSTDIPRRLGYSSFNNRPGGTRARVNRELVNVTGTGLSGDYDLVTLVSHDAFGLNALSAHNYAYLCGGQEIGEAIYWSKALSEESIARVETYLNKKWFGVEPPQGYRGAFVGDLEVDLGAVVNVEGDSPLVVKSLTGAGTVNGAVSLAEGSSLLAYVEQDGSVRALTVGGIDMSAAATVEFSGYTRALVPGTYVLVHSAAIAAGDACAWTAVPPRSSMSVTLRTVGGALVADVERTGTVILVR